MHPQRQDYAFADRDYGKGRAYFTPLGHTPNLYTDRRWTTHLLAAIQYILGDLAADTTPGALLRCRRATDRDWQRSAPDIGRTIRMPKIRS